MWLQLGELNMVDLMPVDENTGDEDSQFDVKVQIAGNPD